MLETKGAQILLAALTKGGTARMLRIARTGNLLMAENLSTP